MDKSLKIYIAGHRGMVGSAVWRALEKKGYTNLIGKTSKELDLRNQQAVSDFYEKEQPEVVIDAAAKVGGILANNDHPYQFLMENMQIQNNLIDGAFKLGVEKFIFLGSSCIYPKLALQPLKEEYLLTDSLEPTNEWYAIAKITGVNEKGFIKSIDQEKYSKATGISNPVEENNDQQTTTNVQPALGKEVLSVDPTYFRPTEVDLLIGDPTKAKEKLGWVPEHDLASLVKDMMQSDVTLMRKDVDLLKAGHEILKQAE